MAIAAHQFNLPRKRSVLSKAGILESRPVSIERPRLRHFNTAVPTILSLFPTGEASASTRRPAAGHVMRSQPTVHLHQSTRPRTCASSRTTRGGAGVSRGRSTMTVSGQAAQKKAGGSRIKREPTGLDRQQSYRCTDLMCHDFRVI